MLVVILAADLYLHHRAERSAGLNRWGYRGPIVGRKQPGELRVVILGGSTAFGYGVTWNEAIPAQLEGMLNEGHPPAPVRVVNLGFNNEGAYSFRQTLEDFRYLDSDIVCLYEGYNDLSGDYAPNLAVYRHESAVFRLTGYFPILPLALREKALALRHGGDLNAAYASSRGEPTGKTVFRPNLTDRTSAAALEAAEAVSQSLSRQLDRVSAARPVVVATTSEAGCAHPWSHYCDSIYRATQYALSQGKSIAIVSQPRKVSDGAQRHVEQQQALAAMLARKFGNEPRVRYVDLRDAVDLSNRDLSFDTMHLDVKGNTMIARHLVEPVRALAATRAFAGRP